jgi:CDP-glucose 4,6-dehydratase
VRAGNVIGGGDWADSRIVPDCFRAWSQHKKVSIRCPDATRPWQHVLEPLSGYLRVGELLAKEPPGKVNGEAFNFGPPADQAYTVLDLLHQLSVNWNNGGNGHELLQVEPCDFHEAGLLKLNCDKALFHLGWKPVLDFYETAAFTSSWYKAYYHSMPCDMMLFTRNQISEYVEAAKKRKILWSLK